MTSVEWIPEYGVGVEIIDSAHKELFRITNRLLALSHDSKRLQWVGEQGIKFLKTYTVNHFAQEEAYMRSINYPDLEAHARQHITMREKILPRMESQLWHEHYSEAAIDKFLNIIQLWLSRHILVHDVAISRRGVNGIEPAN